MSHKFGERVGNTTDLDGAGPKFKWLLAAEPFTPNPIQKCDSLTLVTSCYISFGNEFVAEQTRMGQVPSSSAVAPGG